MTTKAGPDLELETLRSLDILGNCIRHLVYVETPRAIGAVPMLAGTEIDQSRVFDYLLENHEFLRRRLEKLANMMTDLEWIWYIRKLPEEVFRGDLPTTGPYDRSLAETAGVLWGKKSRATRSLSKDGLLQFDVSRDKIRLLIEFAAYIKGLATVQSNLRWCGKGAEFVLNKFGTLTPVSSSLRDAVALYDARIAACAGSRLSFAGAGTQIGENSFSDENGPKEFEVLSLAKSNLCNEYRTAFYNLEKVKNLNQTVGNIWWHPSAPSVVALLRLGAIICAEMPEARQSLTQNGYVILNKTKFENTFLRSKNGLDEMIQTIFPMSKIPGEVKGLFAEIDLVKGSVWPLRPASTRFDLGQNILIDFVSIYARIKHVFEFPRVSSGIGNARADHFELMAQALVNTSKWCPDETLANLRGRPLHNEGRTITDIDAIGCKGKRLLIVDCKSLIFDALYDQGHPSKVRSAIDEIEAKVKNWEKVRQYLQDNPVGANYDFAAYDEIVAVVCTPKPVYLPVGESTEFIGEGLRRCSSLDELDRFLQQ